MPPNGGRPTDLFATLTRVAASAALSGDVDDEIRHSAHAAQLQRGFRWLRFEPALEREFREFFHRRYLIRTRVALIAGALLIALFSLRDVRVLPDPVWHWTVGLRLALIVPSILLVVLLSYARRLWPYLEAFTAAGVTLAMGGLGAAILVSTRLGAPMPYEGLMLVMVFCIFLSGLRFYKAMLSTFLSALAYIVARAALDLPANETTEQAYYMYGITLVGLLGSYSLELTVRANFLTEQVALFRATRDPLTHLHNRRASFEHLQRAWKLGFRDRKAVGVALLDVDHFKAFNDRYGHPQGDTCLAEVAKALRERLRRPMDLVGRYGGEEFVAIFYDINDVTLRVICEDVRRAVEDLAIAHAGNAAGRVTLSVGAACAAPAAGAQSIEWLLEQADQALYRAKAAGRNRCEYAESVLPSFTDKLMRVDAPARALSLARDPAAAR